MRKVFLISAIISCLFIVGCETKTEIKKDDHSNHTDHNKSAETSEAYVAEFKTNPAEAKAGEPTELSFTVKNPKGDVVKDLEIVHEMPLHLLIVSDDLAEFYHEHPEQQADGSFKVPFTFKNGGNFKLYADFKPKDSSQMVQSFEMTVTGNERPIVGLKADEKFEKTVDDLLVTMKPNAELVSNKDLMFDFNVFDAKTKKPVTDLQNYLGELAHFVIISQDLKEFVHAHPMSDSGDHSHAQGGEHKHETSDNKPTVSAHLAFPIAGLYKVFAQFKRNNKIVTVFFVVAVKEGQAKAENKSVKIPKDAVKITVSENGYEPSEVKINADVKRLAFYRADANNCGGEIVFKEFDIKKTLPVGEVVIIDLPNTLKDNTIEFACGMNMLKGKIIIQ